MAERNQAMEERKTEQQAERQAEQQTEWQAERQTEQQAERQAERQTEQQAEQQAEQQTERPTAGRSDLAVNKKESGRRGLIHIYCGDGKGKTTCGMGLCVRAAGAGGKVLIYQFMKDNSTSERRVLSQVPGITLIDGPDRVKFSFQMTEEEKAEQRTSYRERLKQLFRKAEEERYDLLFLDEAIYTVRAGLLPEQDLISCLDHKPEGLEVILTGQGPSEEMILRADYVTEMKKVKHPYDRGISARRGIER